MVKYGETFYGRHTAIEVSSTFLCVDNSKLVILFVTNGECTFGSFIFLEISMEIVFSPASILRKSTSGRHRPVSYPDGPMTARYRFT